MPISRVFQAIPLSVNATLQLDEYATHHIARVLRASVNDELIIFNGEGGEYLATITRIDKKAITVHITEFHARDNESPLELYLAQGISRGEKMDYTIQKAVELGVKKIFPLDTERCNVKLDEERRIKRLQHWGSIIVSACEQSGRNHVPEIMAPQSLDSFLTSVEAEGKFVLAPGACNKLTEFSLPRHSRVVLLIGPEGGLSQAEIDLANKKGFTPLSLGPRILRTETAAVAALAVLQFFMGDFG
jgi:16S rRNA (uracil1498-N3)-methyltransferase